MNSLFYIEFAHNASQRNGLSRYQELSSWPVRRFPICETWGERGVILNSMALNTTKIMLVFCLVLGLAPACEDRGEGPKLPEVTKVSEGALLAMPTVRLANSGFINNSNKAAYAVTGSCSENGRTVTIGGAVSGSGACIGNGFSITLDYSAIADGAVSITADFSDTAGNNATQASLSLTKDTAAPTIGAVADILTKIMLTVSPAVSGAASYAWSKVSGPGTITFGSPTSNFSSVRASADGAYVIRLSATDLAGNTAIKDTKFTWQTAFCSLPQNAVSYDKIGWNDIYNVFASGSTIYAGTRGGLSISSDGGTTWATKTTANGLGNNRVSGVYVSGSTVYAATQGGGLSISSNGGATWANKTTANGLGSNYVNGVFTSGSTVYAATDGGLSISSDGGATWANKTTANGLGNNIVWGVFTSGSTVYAATIGGLSVLYPIVAVH
jgi:hypothetical protein